MHKGFGNTKLMEYIFIGLSSALLTVFKLALMMLPNVELVTFLIILYVLVLGTKRSMAIVLIFIIIEGILWGFGYHFFQYLFIWPLLVVNTSLFKNIIKTNFLAWSIFSGLFGMFFGVLTSIPLYFLDETFALSSIITGLPFDAIHLVFNYIIMLLLGEYVYNRLKTIIIMED